MSLMLSVIVFSLSGCDTHDKPNSDADSKWIVTHIDFNGGELITRIDVNSINRSGDIAKVWSDSKWTTTDGKIYYNQYRTEIDCKFRVRRKIYQITNNNGVFDKEYSGPVEKLATEGKTRYQWERMFESDDIDMNEYKLICQQ